MIIFNNVLVYKLTSKYDIKKRYLKNETQIMIKVMLFFYIRLNKKTFIVNII